MSETVHRSSRQMLLTRFMASGQWERALDTARNWLAEEPENPRAHRCAGQALVNLDREREAEAHIAQALAANPHDAFAYRLMTIVHYRLKRFREADASIHRAIELDPQDSANWHQLALMCYWQGDRKNGLKWVTKARELNPNSSEILNLYALCSEDDGENERLLSAALAANPENAYAHNNLGVHYLKTEKDYAKAEACFRQALTINPTLKVARKNLFIAIKHRDRIYRLLRSPLDLLFSFRRAMLGDGTRRMGAVIVGFAAWFFLARFFVIGLAFWFGLFWPMTKFYEFVVIGDLRQMAGEVGATRGGIFGYRRWPVRVRLALFAISLVAFWTAVYFLLWSPVLDTPKMEEYRFAAIMVALVGVLVYGLFHLGRRLVRKSVTSYHAWRRKRALRGLENIDL